MTTSARRVAPPVGFFDAQRRHRRRTALLIAVELVLVWSIGNLLVLPLHLRGVWWRPDVGVALRVGVVAGLLLAGAVVLARRRALDVGDGGLDLDVSAAGVAGAAAASVREHAIVRDVVAEMALAAGVPAPRVLVVDDPAPNAYAVAGRVGGRDGGAIVCTSGLLATLDRRELTGVVAHEIAHLRNRDSTVVWTATFALGLVVVLAGSAMALAERGRDRRSPVDPRTGLPRRASSLREIDQEARDRSIRRRLARGFALLMWLVARPAAALVRAAVSRRRELLADASAVQFTRDPTGLRCALERIAASDCAPRHVGIATAPLWIHLPTAAERTAWAARLLDSHPPIEQRIAWLRSLERAASGAAPDLGRARQRWTGADAPLTAAAVEGATRVRTGT